MIGLYKGQSARSRLIKFRTWCDYSHASWIDDADMSVHEAWTPGGVRHNRNTNIGHTPGTVIDLFSVKGLTVGEQDGLREFYSSQRGKPYDWRGVLMFVSRRDPANESAEQEKWFCSELVFAGFLYIKRPLLARIPAYKVYPGMLAYSPLLISAGSIVTGKTDERNAKS